ncbi:NADP-dependent malic enzyme [Euphorbia peplus]|nr:NADP-dependent malic enzyme [Euphorbia peplus]
MIPLLALTIDVGTNTEKLLNNEFYIGLRQRMATGQEYDELLHEYGATHLVFNDDFQGTASVVLAGLVAALKLVGGTLADHKFLFLGAGEGGTGIAELIALEMSKQMLSAMFDGGYRERDAKDVEIPNIKWDVFELMMRFIYAGSVDVDIEIAQDVSDPLGEVRVSDNGLSC